MCSSGMRSRIWSQRDKEREVESGLIISSAVFVQRRLRVGGEMTFCSIKLQLFYFCSVATLYLLLLSHIRVLPVCVPVCVCVCLCVTWGEVQGGHVSLHP